MLTRSAIASYAEVFHAAPVGMFIYHLEDPTDDASLRLVDGNATAEVFTGVPNTEVVGKRVDDAFPNLRATGRVRRFFDAIRTGVPVDFGEFEFAHIAGEPAGIYHCRAFPLPDGASIVTFFQNLTAVRTAEREAAAALAAAEEASRAKSLFLANMSHELRTPLNAILGYTDLLIDDAQEAGALSRDVIVPDLEKIQSAGRHLLALVSDVLDLSKIETGKMEVYLEPLDVPSIIVEVTNTIAPLAAKRGNTLETRIDPGLPALVTDVTKLRQSLFNLLSNACKFTENGRVTLDVFPETIGDATWVTFEVADTGIGIAPETLGKLFRNFSQADASTTRRYGGTGLGLAISQQFCQMLGGNITVRSELGRGSRFTLRLPEGTPPARPLPGGRLSGPRPSSA